MKGQCGFTFIEALVAGVVALVIPAVLIVLLNVSNREAGASALRSRLSQIATAVSEDIHHAGDSATWVYGRSQADMTATTCSTAPPLAKHADPNGFAFCDDTKKIVKAYKLASGTEDPAVLEEYDPIRGWRPMTIGGVTVSISRNDAPYSLGQPKFRESGVFGIGEHGAWAWTNFHFDTEIAGERVTLPMQMQSVICRNAPSRMASW